MMHIRHFRQMPILMLFVLCIGIFTVEAQSKGTGRPVIVAHINNQPIMPPVRDYLVRALARAQKENAECLLVEIDTPGGLGESMRDISRVFLESKVPVVVYVTPSTARAASAGAIIALAANIIAMAPGSNIGAAHPVTGAGDNIPTDMRDKVTNDSAALARNIAEKRARDPKLAEDFVRKSISLTATEASRAHLADILATNRTDLFRQLEGRTVMTASGTRIMHTAGAPVIEEPLNQLEDFLLFLFNPNIALILGAIAFYGLVAEATTPGAILPGVTGSIALILSLYSMTALSVNAAGGALLILAFTLFVVDVVATTHGVLTVGGIIAFVFGSLMLFNGSPTGMQVSLSVILTLAGVTSLFTLGIVGAAIRTRRRAAGSGPETLIGQVGEARSDLNPGGDVFVDGALWSAINDGVDSVSKGDSVQVISRKGLKIRVKKA